MAEYEDNLASTGSNSTGFAGHSQCQEACDTATEIMLRKCPEKSIALAITSQDADFDKEGKLKISDEHFSQLKEYHYNGKMTPGNYRKNTRKEGSRRMFYDMMKNDWVKMNFEGEDCTPSFQRRVEKQSERLMRNIDTYYINALACGTDTQNHGCNNCYGVDPIGTFEDPFCIETGECGSDCHTGQGKVQAIAEQMWEYIINFSSVGDNLEDSCDSQQYMILNSCFKKYLRYMDYAAKASCDATCALSEGLRPMSDEMGTMPHIYFHDKVPMGIVDGNQTTAVYGGYYNEDFIIPNDVLIRTGVPLGPTGLADIGIYSYNAALVRPDRKWSGAFAICGDDVEAPKEEEKA